MLKEMPKNQKEVSMCVCIFIVMAMVFPVVIYGCESWTVKKAER